MAPAAQSYVMLDDALPFMLWRARPDMSCEYTSRAWLEFTGMSAEQALGEGWSSAIHVEDLARWLDTCVRAFDCREPFEIECRMRGRDGDYRWGLDRAAPVRGPGTTGARCRCAAARRGARSGGGGRRRSARASAQGAARGRRRGACGAQLVAGAACARRMAPGHHALGHGIAWRRRLRADPRGARASGGPRPLPAPPAPPHGALRPDATP